MIGFTPAKSLKPGMRVQVTTDSRRAITPDEANQIWTVTSACPVRFGGKAGTELSFANGVTAHGPANANWIVESV